MKKYLLLIFTIVFIAACSKNEVDDANYHYGLKDLVLEVDLVAGQHTEVGTVTYLDTEDGFFKITYQLTGGWTMSESHAYAGNALLMPRNTPGAPKIGKFPYKEDHDPEVTTYTYTIPVSSFDNFACAAHAVVNHPTLPSETAWASGNEPFSDKGWGTYTSNFSTIATEIVVVYGIKQTTDGSLVIVYINATSEVAEVIISEPVSSSGGSVLAAAVDPVANNLFFVIGNTLYVNDLNTDEPSIAIGNITGLPGGGAFLGGYFYYMDIDPNSTNEDEIIQVLVSYDEDSDTWSMDFNYEFSDPFPYTGYTITDMAANGNEIYLIGVDINNNADLFVYGVGSQQYDNNVTTTQLNGASQIAFGPNNVLWAIHYNSAGEAEVVEVNLNTGEIDPVVIGDGSDEIENIVDLTSAKF